MPAKKSGRRNGAPLALIMAGGRSERMKVTTGLHKALAKVGRRTLIERNIQALADDGFTDILIALSKEGADIKRHVLECLPGIVTKSAVDISIVEEEVPLGTIGAARLAPCPIEALLVINVDNLSTIPLRRLVNHHLVSGAALTIAAHTERFNIPFGQLITQGGLVTDYLEKPSVDILISSGTYVLGQKAIDLIPADKTYNITDLYAAIRLQGEVVAEFQHCSAWIDINDSSALERANTLFGTDSQSGPPDNG